VACLRHPTAATHRNFCAACLLEEALAPGNGSEAGPLVWTGEKQAPGMPPLSIQVPLGRSPSSSVFLVRTEELVPRLLRLKTWHVRAPDGFLARFQELKERLASWNDGGIDPPLAAGLDAAGCPSVLTEFRQGLPILDRVRSGALGQEAAVALLQPLMALTRAAHERGLVHGSIGPGNVIVQPDAATACLLDFGLVRLLDGSARQGLSPSADLAGWDALARALREPPADPPRRTL